MLAYLRRSGFASADADDLLQETFLRAFRSLRTFDPDKGRFGTWLSTIARNVARRHWARRRSESFDPELAEEMLADPADDGDPAERAEIVAAVQACVAQLPPELATLIRLRYVDGRTTRGVAEVCGLPESTVRLHLQRAQGLLAGCLRAKGVVS